MFLCVSANPAIDKRVRLESFTTGAVNRAKSVERFAGGKATHVAMVLQTLGETPRWIGPCGGATGADLKAGLAALGIEVEAVTVGPVTRTNLEIIDAEEKVTELLEPGAALSDAEIGTLIQACDDVFSEGGAGLTAIFSGSLPDAAPVDLFGRLVILAKKRGCRTMVDTNGEALRSAIAAKPDFVKPNREEASKILGTAVNSVKDAFQAIRKLIEMGARGAAISLGSEGMLFCEGEGNAVYLSDAIALRAASTVGCGDSAVAGFAQALSSNRSAEDALRLATACAAANCIANSPGAARREDIDRFLPHVQVKKLSE